MSLAVATLILASLLSAAQPGAQSESCAVALWAAGPQPRPALLDVEAAALVERSAQVARRVRHDPDSEIWLRPLLRGEYALALVNLSHRPNSPDVVWNELGILKQRGDSPLVRDVLRRRNLGRIHGGFSYRLEPGQCALFFVKP